jgi:hypothetical protein
MTSGTRHILSTDGRMFHVSSLPEDRKRTTVEMSSHFLERNGEGERICMCVSVWRWLSNVSESFVCSLLTVTTLINDQCNHSALGLDKILSCVNKNILSKRDR